MAVSNLHEAGHESIEGFAERWRTGTLTDYDQKLWKTFILSGEKLRRHEMRSVGY